MICVVRGVAAGAAALLVAGVAFAFPLVQEAAKPAAAPAAEKKAIVPFFGNEKCTMTGKPVNPAKYVESDGQRAYFCCNNCLGKAKSDAKGAVAAAYKETKPAGNKKCPVSGHAIEAAKAKEVTFESYKVTLCCGDCEKPFKESPRVFTAMAVYGAEDVGNKLCPVMLVDSQEEDPSDDTMLVVYDGKLVRLCCADCIPTFVKEPAKYMAKATAK